MNLYKYKLLQYYSSKEYDVYNHPIIANGFNDDIGKSCFKIKIPQHILGSTVSDEVLNDDLSYNINIQSSGLNDYTFYVIGTPNVSQSSWNRYNWEKGIDIKIGSQHADTVIYIISDSYTNSGSCYPINISYRYNVSNTEISNLSSNIQSKWKEYFPWEYDGNNVILTKSINSNNYNYIKFDAFKRKEYGYSIGTNLYTSIQVLGQYESLNYNLHEMPNSDESMYDYYTRHITFNGTNITNISGLSIDINQYYNKKSDLNNNSWFKPVFEGSCITSLPYLGTVHNYISTNDTGDKTIINNDYSADNGVPLIFGPGMPGLASAFIDCDLLSVSGASGYKPFPLPWYGAEKTVDKNNNEVFINKLTLGSGTLSGCLYNCENIGNIYAKFYNFSSIPTSNLTNDEHINLAFFSNYRKTSTELPSYTGDESIGTYSSVNSIDRLLNCFNDSGFNKLDISTYKNGVNVYLVDFPIPIKKYTVDDYTYYDPNSPAWKTYYNYLCNLTYSNGGSGGSEYEETNYNANLYFKNKDSKGNEIETNFITNYKPASLYLNEIKYWLLYLKLYFDLDQNNFEFDYTNPGSIVPGRFKEYDIIIPNITNKSYDSDISDQLKPDNWDYLIESKLINITINDNKYYLTTKDIIAVETTTDASGKESQQTIPLTLLGFNINNKFYALNTNLFDSQSGTETPNGYTADYEKLKANCDSYITKGSYSWSHIYYARKTSNGYTAHKIVIKTNSGTYSVMPYSFDKYGVGKLGCTCID